MIEINLLPEEMRKKERIKLDLPAIPVFKILSVFLAVFVGIQVFLSIFAIYQRLEYTKVKNDVARLTKENDQIIKLKSETTAINNLLKEAKSLTDRKFFWSMLLNALSDSMTKGVWLRSLSIGFVNAEQGKPADARSPKARVLNLEGSVVGPGQETAFIGKFIKQLKENPRFSELFDDVKLSNMNQKKIKEFDVYDFVLVALFKKETN